ncbi:MAG: dTDP-4-dehydrorhamnose reductase [Deltaproteobacteria bacterium]|nr:dTDP-4-dehydrorhamnose reductase [Deltaproteobacteria bacterium]
MKNIDIVVIGQTGQLSCAYHDLFKHKNNLDNVCFLSRKDLDLTKTSEIAKTLDSLFCNCNVKVVINTAADTAVEDIETHKDRAFQTNAVGPGILASWCAEKNTHFIHFSTDYVYCGDGKIPWKETSETAPLNVYGASKLAGENKIIETACKHLIFRTSWIYSSVGRNFFTTMLQLGESKEELKIICDQIGAPTYAVHLAEISWAAYQKICNKNPFPSGIYNLCSNGFTSWYGFASKIFELAYPLDKKLIVKKITPVKSIEHSSKVCRPLNSRLALEKFQKTFNLDIPHWEAGLKECMEIVYASHPTQD